MLLLYRSQMVFLKISSVFLKQNRQGLYGGVMSPNSWEKRFFT